MNNFIFHTPTKVFFGRDEELKIAQILKEFGAKKVLLHSGGQSAEKSGLLPKIRKILTENGIYFVSLAGVKPNPELPLVKEGIEICKKENIDFILAVGGGSVLDSAKAISNGYANNTEPWDFNIGKCKPQKTLKKGCILTLSAAGSEMSDSCVISNPETKEKRGYNSPFNRFDFAIMNPVLTFTVPPYQTACGAVDIAMHTIERYFGVGKDTLLTDSIAEAVIKNVMLSARRCLENPEDYDARADMMWASSLAHNSLTGCGREFFMAVHQLEHELSAMYPQIAHGAGLAALFCSWARYVYKADIDRFTKYAHNVWGVEIDENNPEKTVNTAIDKQEEYYRSINMPTGLKALGVKESDLPVLALKCSRNKTRTLGGIMPLGCDDILKIYQMAFDNE